MAFNFSAPTNASVSFPGAQPWAPPAQQGQQPWAPPAQQGQQPWAPPAQASQSQPWAPPAQQGQQPWAPPAQQGQQAQPWAPPSQQASQPQPWQPPTQQAQQPAPAAEVKSSLEVLGDALVELFDKYVRLQCLPHLVEGLQKEGLQVSVEKMEKYLPQKDTPARSALLSTERAVSLSSIPYSATTNMPIGVGQPSQPFSAPQAGAFNPTGFMPAASASTADKTAMEKAKLADPNFNDNYKPGCCLSYPTRGNEGKYRFCGNPVSNQYTIVCEKCRNTRAAARELDAEFTQKLSRREHFDFEGYRRMVAQKRLDYARGNKSGGKKGGNTTAPASSFGFNAMGYSFPGMPDQMQQQQQQPPAPVNNGPPRVCNHYDGPIPEELASFATAEYGIPVFFKNHKLMAMLKDMGNGNEQQVVVLAGADSREGPLRKTTPEDWNMIKISNLKYAGPYIINYDSNASAPPTVPQPQPWNPTQQSAQAIPWNPSQQQQQPQPWNPAQQAQQQPQPWNPTQQPTQQQPQPWNPAQQPAQQQPQPWNPTQQPAQQTQGQQQPSQQNVQNMPWMTATQQPQQQPQQPPASNEALPWAQTQQPPQQTQQPPASNEALPWAQPQPSQSKPATPNPTPVSSITPSSISNDSSLSFDNIVASVTAATGTPSGSNSMQVQQF